MNLKKSLQALILAGLYEQHQNYYRELDIEKAIARFRYTVEGVDDVSTTAGNKYVFTNKKQQ